MQSPDDRPLVGAAGESKGVSDIEERRARSGAVFERSMDLARRGEGRDLAAEGWLEYVAEECVVAGGGWAAVEVVEIAADELPDAEVAEIVAGEERSDSLELVAGRRRGSLRSSRIDDESVGLWTVRW